MTQNQQIKENTERTDKFSSITHKIDRKCATQFMKVNCVGLFNLSSVQLLYEEMFKRRNPLSFL